MAQTPAEIVPQLSRLSTFSLELAVFKVHTYGSGSELLLAKDIRDCACFVIDLEMPGMIGLDLIGKLRDRHISRPAILVISQPSVGLSARAAKANVPIVEKPFLGNTLLDTIRDACGVPASRACANAQQPAICKGEDNREFP